VPYRPRTRLSAVQIRNLRRQHKALKIILNVLRFLGMQALIVLDAPLELISMKVRLDGHLMLLLDRVMESRIVDAETPLSQASGSSTDPPRLEAISDGDCKRLFRFNKVSR